MNVFFLIYTNKVLFQELLYVNVINVVVHVHRTSTVTENRKKYEHVGLLVRVFVELYY